MHLDILECFFSILFHFKGLIYTPSNSFLLLKHTHAQKAENKENGKERKVIDG